MTSLLARLARLLGLLPRVDGLVGRRQREKRVRVHVGLSGRKQGDLMRRRIRHYLVVSSQVGSLKVERKRNII